MVMLSQLLYSRSGSIEKELKNMPLFKMEEILESNRRALEDPAPSTRSKSVIVRNSS